MEASTFPWGERDPEGGYKVGDEVGIIHSDHNSYVFDNPRGVVIAVVERPKDEREFGYQYVTIQIKVDVSDDLVFLVKRDGKSYQREEVYG